MDFSGGIIAAVEHLLGLGHKHFAFLCALAEGQEAGGRPEVFNRLLRERGIELIASDSLALQLI
jgi:DNA-binding LacI/PurR family transcriptional regulator